MEHHRPAEDEHGVWHGMAFLPAGLPVAADAWHAIRHRDGFRLPGLPLASVAPSALLARRAGRGAAA
jgi:hypothetical protein